MTTIFIILTYGIPASLLLSVVILVVELIHPRLLLRGYPKDVQATVSPLTDRSGIGSSCVRSGISLHLLECVWRHLPV